MESCPGQNHDYVIDHVFYTLQTKDGKFLSNPLAYARGEHTRNVLIPFTSPPEVATAVSLTKYWACAWVVYSIEELREIFKLIKDQFNTVSLDQQPKFPCIGRMVRGKYGMVEVKGLRRLTGEEQAELKAQSSRKQIEQKVSLDGQQVKLTTRSTQSKTAKDIQAAFLAAYSGEEAYDDDLPSLPD